jgi:signal transduction histidine kinase
MRKKITVRVLLGILMHLLMGAAFVIAANLFLRSDFSIKYLDGEESYQPADVVREDYSFEDSKLYTEIYTRQLKDIIAYCAIKNVIDKNDDHSYDMVDVLNSSNTENSGINFDQTLVYYIDDLIRWGRSGFTYTQKEYTVEQFMSYYNSPYSFDEIIYYGGDNISYYVNDDGQTIVIINLLDITYPSVDGATGFEDRATNWIEFFDMQDALKKAAEKYVKYYDMYRNGIGLYEFSNTNIKYVLRIGEGNNVITYSNIKNGLIDTQSISDAELTEVFSDYKDFLVYFPESLEFSTFSNVNESDLYVVVKSYADEFKAPVKLWAYIEGDFTKQSDAFSIAFEATSGRKGFVTRSIMAVVLLLAVYVVLFVFKAVTAGIRGSERYLLFWDKIILEVYAILLALFIILSRFMFAKNYNSGISNIYLIFGPLGILTSFSLCMLVFSTIRRVRSKNVRKYSFIYLVYKGFSRVRDRIENSANPYVSALVPFHFYLIINFALFVALVICSSKSIYLGVVLSAILLVAYNVLFAARQIRKSSDRISLRDGIKRITGGELEYKIDEDPLLDINKDLAGNINHLGEGIKNAVETSMRDEKMKSDLITNVSHDLKTPLTSIINYVNLLKDENIDKEPAAGYIRTLEEKSNRLKQLLTDLVDASRLSSGTTEVSLTKIRITELLHQIVAEFSDKFEDAGLEVVFDGEVNGYIMADGRHMWRLMDNLLENVCKYSMRGTRVYVSVKDFDSEEGKRKLLISIKNVSATPNTVQGSELTERFIRGDASRSSEGSGLGLYIAKSLAELQNGKFEVIADGDLFKVDIVFDLLES